MYIYIYIYVYTHKVFNALGDWWLCPLYGVKGAAIATVGARGGG